MSHFYLRSAIWNKLYRDAHYTSCSGQDNQVLAEAVNFPLPSKRQRTVEATVMIGALLSLLVVVPLYIAPGAFVAFQVRESQSNSSYLQLTSGTNLSVFWLSMYLYDLVHFWLLIAVVLSTMLLCGRTAVEMFFSTPETLLVTALLLVGFSMSVLPFSYLIARHFRCVPLFQTCNSNKIFVGEETRAQLSLQRLGLFLSRALPQCHCLVRPTRNALLGASRY